MNTQQLQALEAAKSLTVEEVAGQNPALHVVLQATVAEARKATVLAGFSGASTALTEHLEALDYSASPQEGLRALVVNGLDQRRVTKKVGNEAVKRLVELDRTNQLIDPAASEVPLSGHPLFQADLHLAGVYALAGVAGLPAAAAGSLADAVPSVDAISDEALEQLVEAKSLSTAQASAMGLATSVLNLADQRPALARALTGNKYASLGDKTIGQPSDLALLSPEDWQQAIGRSGEQPPAGLDVAGFATHLRGVAQAVFPTEAIVGAPVGGSPDPATVREALTTLRPVLKADPAALSKDFAAVDAPKLSRPQQTKAKQAHTALRQLARSNPGLGLAELIGGPGATAAKVTTVTNRVSLLPSLAAANPEVQLLALDLSPGSADIADLDFKGLSVEDQKLALSALKANQRAYTLTGDVDDAKTLLAAGFDSAGAIVSTTLENFTKTTGIDADVAERYYHAAQATSAHVSTTVASIVDILNGERWGFGVNNVGPSVSDFLKQIDGYAAMFGSQAYCTCENCQSILGPAAYYVDLMRFVEEHVSAKYFAGTASSDPLNLKTRRPDLWTLPLTCANTETMVPYLDLINVILENAIATRRGYGGNLEDRQAVEELVYRQLLATGTSTFVQPFTLPLTRLESYLRYFAHTREEIAHVCAADADTIAAAGLAASQAAYQLMVTANTSATYLKALFGVAFTTTGTAIDPVEAQLLLGPTGLTRAELGEVVATRFVSPSAPGVQIISEKTSAASVQDDIERVHGLTYAALDRMHRFIRVWRGLGWEIDELDLALSEIVQAGLSAALNAAAAHVLVDVAGLVARWSIPVEEACALWAAIPQVVVAPASQSLFDRLFNLPPFVFEDGTLPKDNVRFIHPSFRASGTADPPDSTMHRLLAGTQLSSDQLAALITALATPLGVKLNTANESDRGFALTVANLTLLYRHARLASLLGVSIADLSAMIVLAGIPNGYIANLATLQALLDFSDWWSASGYSIADLQVITGAATATAGPTPDELASRVAQAIAGDRSLQFADTVFAFLPGVSEEGSRTIVAANQALFEPSPDGTGLRLVPTWTPGAAITIPAPIVVSTAEAIEILSRYSVATVLPVQLASSFGPSSEVVSALITLLGVDLAEPAFVAAVEGGAVAPLVTVISRMIPLTALFANATFDAATIAFVGANLAVFGITDIDQIPIGAVRKLSVYVELTDDADADFNTSAPAPSPADVQAALAGFDAANRFATVGAAALAGALRTDIALINTLIPTVTLPDTAPEALHALARIAALASGLGVGGDVLALIVSADYADLNQAAQAVVGAFRAKFSAEQAFHEAFEPFEDFVRSRRRDALTDAMTRTVAAGEFATNDELYEYYLVDVSLEGCARTSPLVAAISSVQLYVYRVLMGLEQDRRDPTDPLHVYVSPTSIPAEEWTWRQNYRVWEANRKVFLHPESYIEPELRDDKTPSFSELEETLLQTPMDEQNVLDAYSTYLGEFDYLSGLRIAGSFHERNEDSKTDMLHLFGVTPGEPPTYYYRTVENIYYGEIDTSRGIVYHPWQPINVQIPTDKVSPIVYLGRLFVFWTQVTTTPKNEVANGASTFVGYKHRLTVQYTMLRLDGTWTAPQSIALSDPSLFSGGDGIVEDLLASQAELEELAEAVATFNFAAMEKAEVALQTPEFDDRIHTEPLDGYTLTGFQWDRVYPDVGPYGSLTLTGRNFGMRAGVDFYQRVIVPRSTLDVHTAQVPTVISARSNWLSSITHLHRIFEDYAESVIVSDDRNLAKLASDPEQGAHASLLKVTTKPIKIGTLQSGATINVINGSLADAIVDTSGDLLLVQKSARPGNIHLLRRLGTTLGPTLSRTLFTGGVNTLLATATQEGLGEAALPLQSIKNVENKGNAGKLDFKGAFGTYYREIFFHIPFLIANQLNAQLNYPAADEWYRYIFDPAAEEDITLPHGLTPAEAAKRLLDRVWRYTEFRDLDVPTMREILTDPATIEAYKKDPFNPHAIARLRLSAYQKCIVMKYVDNLLDWGDSLFTQFTMESVNEATMLYVMALEILGPRPPQLGSCGESAVTPRDYAHIAPLLAEGSEFLAEVETWVITPKAPSTPPVKFVIDPSIISFHLSQVITKPRISVLYKQAAPAPIARPTPVVQPAPLARPTLARAAVNVEAEPVTTAERVAPDAAEYALESAALSATATQIDVASVRMEARAAQPPFVEGLARPTDWKKAITTSWAGPTKRIVGNDSPLIGDFNRVPGFGWSISRQISPVFCVPPNPELLSYWERVEDRLYKIRHCEDITGTKRQLALFAPEIDPMMLVRMAAAGLSLEEVLAGTGGDLPPYRFTYLIEKAKQYASAVQGFGSQLLGALERKDAEELTLLRATQQQNILQMTTKVRQDEISAAQDSVQALERQQEAVQFRHDYYANLVSSGLSAWEITQSVSRYTASGLDAAAGAIDTIAGIVYLLPQIGSPFAMKYGGQELGNSANAWATVMRDAASVAEAVSSAAGLQAGFERRSQGWKFQVEGASLELKQLERQIAVAQIRQAIAERSMEIHQKTLEQAQEVYDFYQSRFTSLGLFTWLSTTLQRCYRDAYNAAYAMAKLAEQALRFERGEDETPMLEASYWDAEHAGLLAGDQLLGGLYALERRYIETNYRNLEVDQAISLSQIAPAALVTLRETGACDFEIPELIFDVAYPGQYRRQIKAVRLTIPCVTGPFTNVGATLTLTGSKLRLSPKLGAANLTEVPPRRSVSIATSTAQNDAGIFEFSFRDERYMPFEGAGAISAWRLELPASFRQFDYETINDVILHVSYTAEHDDTLRGEVEATAHAAEGAILTVLKNVGLGRVFSLRQDFSGSLNLLLHSPLGTQVKVSITENHVPFFLRGRATQVKTAKLALRTTVTPVAGLTIELDGTAVSTFAADDELGGLPSADVTAALTGGMLGEHILVVKSAGNLAPTAQPGDESALDEIKLEDVLLLVEYTVS